MIHPRARSGTWLLLTWLALVPLVASAAEPRKEFGTVEVLRDQWGIPHVFSDTDEGAMYGLGHATAEERGFQMTYSLRLIQGRSAEILGDRLKPGRRESTIESDRRMRTFGWARAATRTAARLDDGTTALLKAYCDGVNDSFAEQRLSGRLHPGFERLGMQPEPWTPADCLLSWWHLAQFFATDGTRDLIARRNQRQPQPGRPAPNPEPRWGDDTTAVVQEGDVAEEWRRRLERYAGQHGFGDVTAGPDGGADSPRFSHAWVVDGRRSGTGAAVLVADPQTPVRNPALWMEFHLHGKTLQARGIGVPGSPGLLIGFNRSVAWGLTALGADQADLFLLETEPGRTNQYRWNGSWRTMATWEERLRVRGGQDVVFTVRETHLGPVASEFCFRPPGDPEVALTRVPLSEPERETLPSVFAMMRATNAVSFLRAAAGWRFPSANCVYGDAQGQIGYTVLGAIPIRSVVAERRDGSFAQPASGDEHAWRGYVPPDLLPSVQDPKAGYLFSANHRPVASFYPFPLGNSTGSQGDTLRSWRLRERLSAEVALTPAEVLSIHYDTVNPARRELVRLGEWIREVAPERLSRDATAALAVLRPWLDAGASSDLRAEGAALATRMSTFFRLMSTPLAWRYGGGESGLARFLKEMNAKVAADPRSTPDDEVLEFIDRTLAAAWRAGGEGGARAAAGERQALGWMETLDGFGSLDPELDLPQPGITCLDGQTLLSQAAQSYTQWVPLQEVDTARTLCPIGHSDRPDSPWRTSTLGLWEKAERHPAPLSREAVERITVARRRW